MSEKSDQSPEIPSVEESGSSGEQKAGLTGDILPPAVTESSLPKGEFLGAMTELADTRQRGFSGSGETALIIARFTELETDNKALKQQVASLHAKSERLQTEITDLKLEKQVLRSENSGLRKGSWIPTTLGTAATVLITFAFLPSLDGLNDRDWAILGLGALLLIGAVVATYATTKGEK